ncbi:helix-turn-helix transcriptional regulator [Parafrankia sp. FMc2]|uniref:helix-turn-helix transcriptional regulator n=1 Tax=Parafrankia sp. FMc2 TaxID=3233196 RepID=UPI0034D5CA0A
MATRLLRAPLRGILPALSDCIDGLASHNALVMFTGDCPKSPIWLHGDPGGDVTSVELTRLATHVDVGQPWFGEAHVAGAHRPVLAAAAAPPGSAGALLTVLTDGDRRPDDVALEVIQQLWDLATRRVLELFPAALPVNTPWIANSEQARAIADLTDAHVATLTGVLGVLRTNSLDDGVARRTAVDLAASALVKLRSASEDDLGTREEVVDEAFGRLSDMLGLLSRYSDVAVEFSLLDGARRMLPPDIARVARTTGRGTVLAMLEQGDVRRIRVSWQVTDTELRTVVRDDGPGRLTSDALAIHRLTDRVVALNGLIDVDSVAGWGTIVTVQLPLAAPESGRGELGNNRLSGLNPRELDVLHQLASGLRNRAIANRLHISEHTVKFHVANILKKVGVDSRGEAAAVARAAGFPAEPPLGA